MSAAATLSAWPLAAPWGGLLIEARDGSLWGVRPLLTVPAGTGAGPEPAPARRARRLLGELLERPRQLRPAEISFLLGCPRALALSPFRREVLRALLDTAPGQLLSYGRLARELGRPGAARAVGQALAGNPFPILIPCHRVIPSDPARPAAAWLGRPELAPVASWLRELERRGGAPRPSR